MRLPIALALLAALCLTNPVHAGLPCDPGSVNLALYDMASSTYKTFAGGLYADGANLRPLAHEAAGRAMAESLLPIDINGIPDPNGRIVLISIGYSNMTQEWRTGAVGDPASQELTFTAKALAVQVAGGINPQVVIIDGAQGGQSSEDWAAQPVNPNQAPWQVALQRLLNAGSSRFQVQVACMKVAHASPNQCMADDGSTTGMAGALAQDIADSVRNLKQVFPNLRICHILTRTYGGYALTQLNPEPFAFETGFSVKWVVESQITASQEYGNLNFAPSQGPVAAPWIAWGPYLWANGTTPNGMGLWWELDDFRKSDRTHPAAGAVDKVGNALLEFFLNDPTTRPWFRGACDSRFDYDADCDIDLIDYETFQDCVSGPTFTAIPQDCSPAKFQASDLDNDRTVDLRDAAEFLRRFSPAD